MRGPAGPTDWSWRTRTHRPRGNAAVDSDAVDAMGGRTVGDVALLLSVIAGAHRDDPMSLTDDPAPLATVHPADLRGLRVAWAPTLGDRVPVDAEVLAPLETAVGVFAAQGAHIEPACPDLDGADATFRTLRAVGFNTLWGDQLDATPEAFKADLAWNIREGRARTGRDVGRALAELTRLQRSANSFFDTYDVLIAPVSQVAPFDADQLWPNEVAGVRQDTYLDWMASCYLITTLGVPAISVPAGFTPDGLPVGLQIVWKARGNSPSHQSRSSDSWPHPCCRLSTARTSGWAFLRCSSGPRSG